MVMSRGASHAFALRGLSSSSLSLGTGHRMTSQGSRSGVIAPFETGLAYGRCASAGAAFVGATFAAQRRRGRGQLSSWPTNRHVSSSVSAVSTTPLPDILFRQESGPPVGCCAMEVDKWAGEALVLFLWERPSSKEVSFEMGQICTVVDQQFDGVVNEFIKEEAFDAKKGTVKSLRVFRKDVKRVVLVGLGPKTEQGADWRLAGATAAGALRELKGGSVGFAGVDDGDVDVQSLIEGVMLGLHMDLRFRGTKTPEHERKVIGPSTLELVGFPQSSVSAIEVGQAAASGTIFARELVNAAPNVATPETLVTVAKDLAEKVGLKVDILDEAACEQMGMGSFLAVGRCSDIPSSLIHLTYSPPGGVDALPARKVGIVGKGVTFDSGGYNLKAGPGSMIEKMKFDMGGAAATLGAAATIAQLKPTNVEVHFVIAACENMISGNHGALRPGDIVTAMDGTTIEVNNTDAEGRLTLADALLFCQNQGVTEVVDVATLTGACMVALGNDITGLWSNSDKLSGHLEAAAKSAGEKVWRMPLEDGYFEGLKSKFADMVNTGPREGGAITAALFLSKFVHDGVDWAHLDIAGPVWAEKAKGTNVVGGTGVMVRTLSEFVIRKHH
eukprot:TRINITY_DN74090_c0_g1_i1.p1 TRINITY_DN74090_c0_g1~~TRINITY_DN74090_c0_g1_i1.p1  ORF type:complete len:614 (+),score=107.25 TRINITY_DN74090_c0_g1_i1:119-1960(+)